MLCNEGDKIMFISSRRNSYVAYKLTGKRGIPCLEDKFPISEQQKDDYVEITEEFFNPFDHAKLPSLSDLHKEVASSPTQSEEAAYPPAVRLGDR